MSDIFDDIWESQVEELEDLFKLPYPDQIYDLSINNFRVWLRKQTRWRHFPSNGSGCPIARWIQDMTGEVAEVQMNDWGTHSHGARNAQWMSRFIMYWDAPLHFHGPRTALWMAERIRV